MMNDKAKDLPSQPISRLLAIMAQLRNPDGGCAWDLEQDFASIAPYTIEEAYEVADAIQRGDMDGLRGELGDLLLQVVFHAQMANEKNLFDFEDVATAIADKMIKRHPHVFGDADARTTDGQLDAWEKQKAEERAADGATSALDGVAAALPALMRAQKLQSRAAKVGFEWETAADILPKLDEEILEVKEAMTGNDRNHLAEELGDALFVLVNLIRKSGFDAEELMRAANDKFTRRFHAMERLARQDNQEFNNLDLDAQEKLWQRAKAKTIT
ncbi:MAG TPA: nucleoside triphosphate pyrophosphohydrolase [Rhodospirillaceae bacterium]|nr:nucleoside triphosphate pyrophosphohydrolase [Rhodospirillaceae bacterium]